MSVFLHSSRASSFPLARKRNTVKKDKDPRIKTCIFRPKYTNSNWHKVRLFRFLKQVLICEDKKKYIAAKSIQCGIQLTPWVKPAYHYIAVGVIGYLCLLSGSSRTECLLFFCRFQKIRTLFRFQAKQVLTRVRFLIYAICLRWFKNLCCQAYKLLQSHDTTIFCTGHLSGRLNMKIMRNKIDDCRESTFHRDIVTTMNKAHQR